DARAIAAVAAPTWLQPGHAPPPCRSGYSRDHTRKAPNTRGPAASPRRHRSTETTMSTKLQSPEELGKEWSTNPRWAGITRNYTAGDVVRLRGTVHVEHSLARLGAEKLWTSLHERDYVNALGALTGNQAMQQVKAGLKAIYLSGWQVARSEEHTSELQSRENLVCRLLL